MLKLTTDEIKLIGNAVSFVATQGDDDNAKRVSEKIGRDGEKIAELLDARDDLLEACRNLLDDLLTALDYHTDHESICHNDSCLYCQHIKEALAAIVKAQANA
jgi:hypothetical protein